MFCKYFDKYMAINEFDSEIIVQNRINFNITFAENSSLNLSKNLHL
jgi:hypothetical protein